MIRRGNKSLGGLLGMSDRLTGGGTDRGTHGYQMGNQTFYDTEGEEGKNFLKATDRYYTKDAERRLKKGQEASMSDFGDEEGGGAWNETLGLLDPDSIGTEEKEYRDVDTEGDNRYLNKLARERFAEQQDMSNRLDLPGISEKISGQSSPELSADQLKMMGPEYESNALSASYLADEDENALDAMARTEPERLIAERAKQIGMADSGMLGGEEEGGTWDKIKGLFSSDDEVPSDSSKDKALTPKQKAMVKFGTSLLAGSADAPTQKAPSAGVKMGKMAFPGLLAASQRPVTPRYTPKGLG